MPLRILIIINKIGKQISTIEMTKTKARNIKNIIIGITIKKKEITPKLNDLIIAFTILRKLGVTFACEILL